ncbi:hypothetical protein F2Q69_00053171, partial [Brassica cretica]
MEGHVLVQRLPARLVSPSLYQRIGYVSIRRSVSGLAMDRRINSRAPSQFAIRAQQVAPVIKLFAFSLVKESLGVASSSSSVENDVRIKEWEVDMYQKEVAISQGIRIRRKPRSKAPLGYYGPFELRLRNAHSPTNILEEITWFKDQEVSQVRELNPLEALKKVVENAPPTRDFLGALRMAHQRTGFPALIAELGKVARFMYILSRRPISPILSSPLSEWWLLASSQLGLK